MTPSKKGLLKVEYAPIRSVKPAKGNTRVHPPEQITEVMRSIEAFGWTKPIIVDERREILAGHGAYQAALQLGMTEVPIIQRAGLSHAQKRAYRTADNKIGENSDWDFKILATELGALKDMGFDMTLTGFKPGEIEALLRPPPSHHQEPIVPDQQGPTITKPGDVWAMGEHRLICADSTKPATYETLMDGRQAALVFTDPPYGVSYQASNGKYEELTGDKLRRGQLRKMLSDAFANAVAHTTDSAAWYVWHADKTAQDFRAALNDHGIVFLALSDGAGTVWEVGRDTGHGKEQSIHPTQKPVELARRAIKNSSREGEIVLDFFAGSGSTLIGCEQLKRACYAIELDPRYCDAIIHRWETMTGKKAIHAEEKKTHEAIAKARGKEKSRAP